MNTPVSGGAVSDEQLLEVLKTIDPETKRLPKGMRAFAHAVLALTQPAVPVLASEPVALLRQALVALESCGAGAVEDGGNQWFDEKLVDAAHDAIENYLAAPQPAPKPSDLREALAALLSLVRREAPQLSGKVLGDADRALAAPLASEPEPVVAEQARDWKPIATAPRDGRSILIAFGQDGVSQAKYIPGLPHPWQFIDTSDGITWMVNHAIDGLGGPSHWQELPIWAPVTLTGQAVSREIGSAPKEVQILIAERDNLASAFARMATLAVQALEYHQEQTRPIDRTTKTINQLRATLASQSTPPPESTPQPAAQWVSLTDGEWVNIVNSDEVINEGDDVHGAVRQAFKLIETKLREKNETNFKKEIK